MDIAAARTFLEIVNTGSFVSAAANLHITQTAVSARVRVLEDELGQQLFIRAKAGTSLTPAGQQFMRYATAFVQMWERARHAVALPPGRAAMMSLGAELIVSNPLVQNWLLWTRREHPELALSAHIDSADALVERVRAGSLDLAVLYGAPRHPSLVAELLVQEKLILVETLAADRAHDMRDHVEIDWGRDFSSGYRAAFPERRSAVKINYGPAALEYLLAAGGSAYLRTVVARPLIQAGRVRQVPDSPEFPYSIHAIYSSTADEVVIGQMRRALRASMQWLARDSGVQR